MIMRIRVQRLPSDLMAAPVREPLLMTMHLLANPGDSLLLQHTLDRLLKWVWPGLRLFHVSERACPVRDRTRSRLTPAGYPSLAVTLFLHESYGEERILRVLDFLQRPPWQYHHTESCMGGRTGGIHIASTSSPTNALLRPYLLPSRDFYSLGSGMPVWGVRPVHCGDETLRVTLFSAYDNFEDAVRLYETVLQRQAEEQKAGFCWFTLHTESGLGLQLALKQLSPGVSVEPCHSAILQFRAHQIGQLVPLLPNPCCPISATRWQTEDLDGNKILFQVKGQSQPQCSPTSAFSLNCPTPFSRSIQRSVVPILSPPANSSPMYGAPPVGRRTQAVDWGVGGSVGSLPAGLKCWGAAGYPREESAESDSCSTPPSSSCYSSQCSSPALLQLPHSKASILPPLQQDPALPYTPPPLLQNPVLSSLLPGEWETDVDTGFTVEPKQERPPTVGASILETVAKDLYHCLPDMPRAAGTQGMSMTSPRYTGSVMSSHCTGILTSHNPSARLNTSTREPGPGLHMQAEHPVVVSGLSPSNDAQHTAPHDEFFI
ncbi:hypothetical protein JZ751_002038 [Albula glossodonta]|uniref:FAM124 domain-containing protein n=1 Tax=Albula glossodonta TaxID=121402 RepID=A0A8T2P4A5_9TELE|nr:hypothetical protein JZ751_002038 [Albula glossodonta]